MYSMKKYLLLFLCLTLGVAYAQDTLRVRVMTYNLRFGELASLEELAHHIKSFKPDFVALQEVDSKTDRKRTPHQKGTISAIEFSRQYLTKVTSHIHHAV